jgi:prevent-host-death family protein
MTMVKSPGHKQIAAAEFKAKCLQIMDRVASAGQPVVVTKRGKPIVRIVPIEANTPESIFGCLASQFEIVGDVEGSILPADLWGGSK